MLITSCHVSEKSKIGPEIAHIRMITKAPMDVPGRPVNLVTKVAMLVNHLDNGVTLRVEFIS